MVRRIPTPLTHSALTATLVVALGACSGARSPTRTELSPGVVFPTALGEGHGDDPGEAPPHLPPPPTGSAASQSAAPASAAPPSPSASAVAPGGKLPAHGGPPDPDPLRLADQWEYEFEYQGGAISVVATTARHFATPVASARRFGRFAVELWIGQELVERIRFDFPGLAPEAAPSDTGKPQRLHAPPDLGKGVHVRQTVLVPAAPRARRAQWVDRATGEVRPLPWPPDHPLSELSPPG